MIKYVLPSGDEFNITPLPFDESWEISQNILHEIKDLNINLEGVDFESIKDADVIRFMGPICHILSSHNIRDKVIQCFKRCNINGQKVGFEEKRGDYVFAAFYALKENVYPFFENLATIFQKVKDQVK